MLTSIAVANYRSYVDRTTVQLRPLTLLFGYNNAGKSSLLRLLPLLADSVRARARGPLDLTSLAARGGSFRDLATRPPLGVRPEIDVEVSWACAPEPAGQVDRYSCTVRSMPEYRREIIHSFALSSHGESVLDGEWIATGAPQLGLGREYRLVWRDGAADCVPLDFEGLVPMVPRSAASPSRQDATPEPARLPWMRFIEQAAAGLRSVTNDIQWLGSLRVVPGRVFIARGGPPPGLEPDGNGTQDILVYDRLAEGKLLAEVSGWYQRHFDQRLEIEPMLDGFAFSMAPVESPEMRVNLADTGEGMAQVLPVLVALAMASDPAAERGRLLALEQPELHLHPAAQHALGEHICAIAGTDEPPTIVVETHSENLLLSAQIAVARGHLEPDRVLVYWIEQLADGRSLAQPIELDKAARLAGGWPPSVFSERLRQSRELILARRSREAE